VLIFRRTIVLLQHLVSSLTLGDCSVHRLREDSRNLCTEQSPTESDGTRCCNNTIVLLKMNIIVLKHVEVYNKCIKINNLCIKLVKKGYHYISQQNIKTCFWFVCVHNCWSSLKLNSAPSWLYLQDRYNQVRFFLLRILRLSWCPLDRLPARRRVSLVMGLPP